MNLGRPRLFVLLAAYAVLATIVTVKDNLTYRYRLYFIQDWHFGFIKRALAGEFFHHIYSPPYSIAQFQVVAMALLLAVTALLVIFALCSGASWEPGVWGLFWGFVLTSPLAVKYLAFDYGRSDHYGFLALLLIVLVHIQGRHVLGAILTAVALPVLALINENMLLLFGPALCLLWVVFGGDPKARAGFVPALVLVCSFGLVLLIPKPHVAFPEFQGYYQSISVDSLGREIVDPFLGLRDVLVRTFRERQWTLRMQPEQVVSYLAFLVPAVFVLWKLGAGVASTGSRTDRIRFGAGLALVALAYLPLYVLGTDWDRWTEDLLIVGIVILCSRAHYLRAVHRFGAPTRALLALGIAGQVFVFRGFGIWNPYLEMVDWSEFTWLAVAAVVAAVFYGLARPASGPASSPVTPRMAAWLAVAAFVATAVVFLALRGPEALGGYPTTASGCSLWAAAALAAALLFAHRALGRAADGGRSDFFLAVLYFLTANLADTPHLAGGWVRWLVPIVLTGAEALGLWAATRQASQRLGPGPNNGGAGWLAAAAAIGLVVGVGSFPTRAWQAMATRLQTTPTATEIYFEPRVGLRWALSELWHSPALALRHVVPWVSRAAEGGPVAVFPPLLFILLGAGAVLVAGLCLLPPRLGRTAGAVSVFLIGLWLGRLAGGDIQGFLIYFFLSGMMISALVLRALGEGEVRSRNWPTWRVAIGFAATLQTAVALLWGAVFVYEARGLEPMAGSRAYLAVRHLLVPAPGRSGSVADAAAKLAPQHCFSGNGVATEYFGSRYQIAGLVDFVPLPGAGFYSLERRFRYLKPGLEPLAIFIPVRARKGELADAALVVATPQYGQEISSSDFLRAAGKAVPKLNSVGVPADLVQGEDSVLGASLSEDSVPIIRHMAPLTAEFFDGLYQERVLRIDGRLFYVFLFAPMRHAKEPGLGDAQTTVLSYYLGLKPISVSAAPEALTPVPPSMENLRVWLQYGGTEIPDPLVW